RGRRNDGLPRRAAHPRPGGAHRLPEVRADRRRPGPAAARRKAIVRAAGAPLHPTLLDVPAEAGLRPLRRLGCKMATGSGKTVVMGMLIAWAFCNRACNSSSALYPSA